MDMAMIRDHLAQAERHVARGRQHIASQKQIISDLERGGHDTTVAWKLLDTFRDIQDMHLADRDRLRKELAEAGV